VTRYEDRVVLITGAAQGLGLAMAERFTAEGATVILADTNARGVAHAAERLNAEHGPRAVAAELDVTSPLAVDDLAGRTLRDTGRLDVLVNAAGIIRDNRIEKISEEDWHAVVDVSLTGTFHCIRAVLPSMKSQGYGRILSFSSMSWRGNFGQANYVAAKAGIVGLTRATALEAARHGVTVNAIAPGLIETPMLESMNGREREKLIAKIPAGHTGDPTDIAATAAFLCSEEAGYITGAIIDVDGGIGIGASIR
jgi:3-oxoacyl-[acyl-carrier protein] reductase